MTFDEVKSVLAALEREGVEYVLVGGVAVGLHGLERATNDIDLFIRPEEDNVRKLRAALSSVYDDPSIEEISFADLVGDYPTIRYGPPTGDYFIDILSRLGTEVAYDDLEAQTIPIEEVSVRVATPETLYRMKRGTIRAIDQIDAANLKQRFGLED